MIEEILLKEMKKSVRSGEVPISALVIHNGKIVSKAHNNKNINNDVLGHAEILALKRASKKLKTWNLSGCALYVTVEPCAMCKEIIKESRIKEVYYYLNKDKVIHNKLEMKKVVSDKSGEMKKLLKSFFKSIRNNK